MNSEVYCAILVILFTTYSLLMVYNFPSFTLFLKSTLFLNFDQGV